MIAKVHSASTNAVRRSGQAGDTIDLLDKRVPHWDRSQLRVYFEQQWVRNCAFFGGKQHFSMFGNQLVDVPPEEHEIRFKANLIKPAVLKAVSKIINVQGRMGVAPAGPASREREIARRSDIVAGHIRTQVDYQAEKAMAYLWSANCGTSFLWNTWDPSKGDADRFYWYSEQDKQVIPASSMHPEERARRDREQMFDDLPQGEVSCEASGPFSVYVDRATKDKLEHAAWIIDARYVDRSWVAETFNVNLTDIPEDNATATAMRYEEALAYMSTGLQGTNGFGVLPQIEFHDKTWLRRMWQRPSRAYPKGRYVVAAGDMILRDEQNPYVGDRTGILHLPCVKVVWCPAPGRFWGHALVDDLTSPQFRHNESRSRMLEVERIGGRPVTFVPRNSGIPTGELVLKSGAVYEYNHLAGAPVFMPPPVLPVEVYRNAEMCKADVRESVSGGADGSKMPASLRSGEAVNAMLREQDVVLDLTMQASLRVDRDAGRQHLALAQLFVSMERMARFRGQNGQYGVLQFKGADLSNDVRIYGEPGQLETAAQSRAAIMDAVQIGALVPAQNPQHAQIVFKALKFGSAEEAIDDLTMHEERQEAEIRDMLANPAAFMQNPYPVMPYEDHTAHTRALVRFFHQDDFFQLDPATKSVLVAHWQLHADAIAQQQQALLQMQEQTKGTPTSPGHASQPSR